MCIILGNYNKQQGFDREVLLKNRKRYIRDVLEYSGCLPGPRNYVATVLVAHYVDRKTQEYVFTYTDAEIRDFSGAHIPTSSLSGILSDLDVLNEIIEIYGFEGGKAYDVKRYIDFESVMNKQCRGGFAVEASGVFFLHFNMKQFEAISSIPSIEIIKELTSKEVY